MTGLLIASAIAAAPSGLYFRGADTINVAERGKEVASLNLKTGRFWTKGSARISLKIALEVVARHFKETPH